MINHYGLDNLKKIHRRKDNDIYLKQLRKLKKGFY